MKYLVLLIGDGEVKPWPEHSDDEKRSVMARFEDFDDACRDRDEVALLAAEALGDPRDATIMRTTFERSAPSAMRMPISCRRSDTAYATTP